MPEHPACPVSRLFQQLENKLWYFEVEGRVTIPIRSARGPWREVIGRAADSLCREQDKAVDAILWLAWIQVKK